MLMALLNAEKFKLETEALKVILYTIYVWDISESFTKRAEYSCISLSVTPL
jgi:hypothetical protein